MVSAAISYRETPPDPALSRWVECYWTRRGTLERPTRWTVLPDGCMDVLVWDGPRGPEGSVVGTHRQVITLDLEGDVSVF